MTDAKTEAEFPEAHIRNGKLSLAQAPVHIDLDEIDYLIRQIGDRMRGHSIPRQSRAIASATLLLATAEAILLAESMQYYDQDMIRREAKALALLFREEPGLN